MRRGEVWLSSLDPTVGTEIQKTRPCLIVSPDALNDILRRVIVAPLTSGSHPAPFRVPVTFRGVPGLILPDQLRTLDKTRLVKRLGQVDPATLAATLSVLGEMFGEQPTVDRSLPFMGGSDAPATTQRGRHADQYTRFFGLMYSTSSVIV